MAGLRVLLRVEIAVSPQWSTLRHSLGLVSVALILTSRWAAVSCYAVLCSPDVPPVPGFPDCTSGGLACFTALIIPEHGVHCAEGIENRCSTSHRRAMTEPTHFDTGAREWDQRPTSLQLAAVPRACWHRFPSPPPTACWTLAQAPACWPPPSPRMWRRSPRWTVPAPCCRCCAKRALPTSPRCNRTSSTACPSATTPS